MDSLERLQGLHADLVAFTETRLANIDRLWHELEDSLQEFRLLLDKPQSTQATRESYRLGKITVNEQEYGINEDFRHLSLALGSVLAIDEEEAGRLIIETQTAGEISDEQSLVADVVSKYHDRRDLLLQSLRITFEQSLHSDSDHDVGPRPAFHDIVRQILDVKDGPPANGSVFLRKCLGAMEEIETWQAKLAEQIQSKVLLSQARGKEFYATLEFQRGSLFKQHEALGAIVAYLFRGSFTISEDLRKLYNIMKKWQRMDFQWIHYLPAFSAGFHQYGSPDGSSSLNEARSLHSAFTSSNSDAVSPVLRPFCAVIELWWVAEYSCFFRDPATQDSDGEKRIQIVKQALKDGSLELLLSICSSITTDIWRQPARQELLSILIDDRNGLNPEAGEQTSTFFHALLMECFETFADAWISNMPDSIRQLKNEEDDQRLTDLTALQEGIVPNGQQSHNSILHLESFLVLIAFAYEHRPEAAETFWDDPDGNLYGFLQWASRRQTVPRASAFCEMLCAISGGPECGGAAHKFLLDESTAAPSARGRRMPTMNYQQILSELEFYALKVHERVASSQMPKNRGTQEPDLNEAESPVMLSCYLRLLSHLCCQSPITRNYLLSLTTMDLPMILLVLSSGPIPSFVRASIFNMLEAFLTDKDAAVADKIWHTMDRWASNAQDRLASGAAAKQATVPSLANLQSTLDAISTSIDQSDAFVQLLRSLITPIPVVSGQPLPFPTDLGSEYRSPGISPYIDFVCGQFSSKRSRENTEDNHSILRDFHSLDFIAAGLEGFNEYYLSAVENAMGQVESNSLQDYSVVYAQRHPFGRLMQWLFSVDMMKNIVQSLHVPPDRVAAVVSEAPLVIYLQRGIDVANMVLDYQPTYFDLVRPLQKDLDTHRAIRFSGMTTLEDNIVTHPEIILDLCQYAAAGHMQLSLRSLALLQKLSSSSKLNNQSSEDVITRGKSRRIIDMIGTRGDIQLLPVAEALSAQFQIDIRELEAGFESPGYQMKDGAITFLNACLSSHSDLPTIAHLILGFGRIGERLTITSQLEDGSSLLDAVVELANGYPDGENGALISWLIHTKAAAMGVLRHLWSSSLSVDLTLNQLRRFNFLSSLFATQTIVAQTSVWDGHTVLDPEFWQSTSAEAFSEFLSLRAAIYDYASCEIRSALTDRLRSVQQQLMLTIQGSSTYSSGTRITHPTIFDLFDFAELDTLASLEMPALQFYHAVDFEAYKIQGTDEVPELYNIPAIRLLLESLSTQISQESSTTNKQLDQDDINLEVDNILSLLNGRNRWTIAQKSRILALQKYVDMVLSVVENSPMEPGPKSQFIMQMLQLILPKLDTYMVDQAPETIELARVADGLLFAISQNTDATVRGRMDNLIAERIFQLFRISIEGITLSNSNVELRTILYSICSQYLTHIGNSSERGSYRKARNNSMDCVRSAAHRLVNILSDDAEDGSDSCRINALNMLGLLASLARSENSNVVTDALVKANILEVMLEPVKHVAAEFQNAESRSRRSLLSIFESRMLLLVQISRTRAGASALLDAGLVQTLRDSMIFRADPDLGMDLEMATSAVPGNSRSLMTTASRSKYPSSSFAHPPTSALQNYFTLLSSALRVLLATFLSRGPQNEQVQFLIRSFLSDYRANMVGVFKKATGINGKVDSKDMKNALDECVRCYTGLIVGCGFAEFEDENALDGLRAGNAGQGIDGFS